MRKKILHTALFLAGFVLVFALANFVMAPKNNSAEAGIHDDYAKGFLAEPENSLDVLILGDSEVYSGVAPLTIWEAYGIACYDCGTCDQKLYQTEDFLRRAFETQSPRIVLLETNILYRDHSTTDVIPHRFEELFPLIRYHDRWKDLSFADFTSPVRFTSVSRNKGYIYHNDIFPADDSGYMLPTEDAARIPGKNVRHVENILALCRENGAQLVLFSTPSTINWSYLRHNAVAELARELDVEYVDLNLLTQELSLDWQLDTRDYGDHMNYTGAVKVSLYLGQYLWERNLFTDKRLSPDYAQWNNAVTEFYSAHAIGPQPN